MLCDNPYVRLMRLEKPIGTGLLLMPCLWGIWAGVLHTPLFLSNGITMPVYYSILFLLGALVMRSAGCVINDYFDRHIDKQVERTKSRPLASGEINPLNALILFGVLSLIGLWILLQLPPFCIIIGGCMFVPIIVYPLMKRITYFPQLFLGIIYNSGIIIGYGAITQQFNPHILWLYISGVLITLAYDTIYAFCDVRDDIKIGVKSSAIAWQHSPKLCIGLCYGVSVLCFAIFFQNTIIINLFLFAILALIAIKLYKWDTHNHTQTLGLFKQNFYLLCLLWCIILFGKVFL